MLDDTKRRELLALAGTEGILAVRAWKRRSATTAVVVDAEANANENDIFTKINSILKNATFEWVRSDQKKNYVQNEYSYKTIDYKLSVIFVSQIQQAI